MTALSVAQAVATLVGLQPLVSLTSGSDPDAMILREVMDDVVQEVTRAHPWQKLARRADITVTPAEFDMGDFTDTEFVVGAAIDLPDDFHYMRRDAQLWVGPLQTPLTQIQSQDEWIGRSVRDTPGGLVPAWILYGDVLYISPSPTESTTVSFIYQANRPVISEGVARVSVRRDDDEFVIPQRVVRLGMIAKYRELSGLPYAEQMQSYQTGLAQEIGRDGGLPGVRILGRPRWPRGVELAWPRPIVP